MPISLLWAYILLGVVLLVSAITDVRRGRIYNVVTYPTILAGLVGHTIIGGLRGDGDSLGLAGSTAGLALGAVPLGLAWTAGLIGAGDVKLMAAFGALAGWRFTLSAMFYGFAAAALLAIAMMVRTRVVRRTAGRLWRYLVLSISPGAKSQLETQDSPTVPFGLALCIGAAAALLEAVLRGPDSAKMFLGI